MVNRVLQIVVPLAILTLGALAVYVIFRLSPAPAQATEREEARNVEVVRLTSSNARPLVSGTGEVTAAEKVIVSPEVTGRITKRHEALISGGRIRKGEVLVRLDRRDYQLALRQEEARVRSSRLEVEMEQGRRQVAEQEWEFLGDGRSPEQARLVLRRPHFETAQANLDSAEAGVERARLNLSRTTLYAPFNALVVEASADQGQLVSPTSRVATLVGTDRLWVQVSVPMSSLPDLEIPGVNSETGSGGRVVHDLGGGRQVIREGRVIRLEGQLDTETRTASLLVEVESPFDEPQGGVPLLPGAFVSVELEGREVGEVIVLPRPAVHRGSEVWVVSDDDRLERRTFEIRWGTEEELFVVSPELREGERVVVSPLSQPIEGERVRITSGSERVIAGGDR